MPQHPGGWPTRCFIGEGVSGDWRVERFEITKQAAEFSHLRAAFGHPLEAVDPGHYTRLTHHGHVVMSNTRMELETHEPLLHRARGRILLNGLGLGMALAAVLNEPRVTHVTLL